MSSKTKKSKKSNSERKVPVKPKRKVPVKRKSDDDKTGFSPVKI